MSRKKFILSIFLMAALVSVGIILPAMHRDQDSRSFWYSSLLKEASCILPSAARTLAALFFHAQPVSMHNIHKNEQIISKYFFIR